MAHPGGQCALMALCLAVGVQQAGGTLEELLPPEMPRVQRSNNREKLVSEGWAALQQRARTRRVQAHGHGGLPFCTQHLSGRARVACGG